MTQNGNAFVYILIAVVLFAGLTYTLTSNMQNTAETEISDAAVKTTATQILSYAALSKSAINRMINDGTTVDDIDFSLPSSASFNTGDTTKKLFHPDGGGLQWAPLPAKGKGATLSSPVNSYLVGKIQNVGWTPTTQSDLLFFAYGISLPVCKELNRKITTDVGIPTWSYSTQTIAQSIATTGYLASSFTSSGCAYCNEKAALCLKDSANIYSFYSMLLVR